MQHGRFGFGQKWVGPAGQALLLCLSLVIGIEAATAQSRRGRVSPSGPVRVKVYSLYRDSTAPLEARVADLLSQMTWAEKIAQLECIWSEKRALFTPAFRLDRAKARKAFPHGIGHIARPSEQTIVKGLAPRQTVLFANDIQRFLVENTRLGIPAIMHEESLHGQQALYSTNFPTPLALASTFDTALVYRIYRHVGREASLRGAHQVLAPVVDIGRDPRWGRMEETLGEDPYLTSTLGVSIVRAYQGVRPGSQDPIRPGYVIATLKHFPVHGTPEGGVNIAPSFVDERTVREVNFPAFERAVRQGGALAVMPCYNELSGVPAHANGRYINGVLRKEWGFGGIVVSDYQAIPELKAFHHVVDDMPGAARLALASGVDVELPDRVAYKTLVDDPNAQRTLRETVDTSVARVLRLKFRLGLFERPYRDADRADTATGNGRGRALARHAAARSLVLLKNEGGILPINPTGSGVVALIGPNADLCHLGGYSNVPRQCVTPRQGLERALGAGRVRYAEGVRLTERGNWFDDTVVVTRPEDNRRRIREAMNVARGAQVIVLCIGSNPALSREGWAVGHLGDRPDITLPGDQSELIDSLAKLGIPMVGVLISGPPITVTRHLSQFRALLNGFYLGQETGDGIADVLTGAVNPSGKLPVSIARSVGHLPAYYAYKPSGRRGYLLDDVTPLFPFGFGLSYTTFKMAPPAVASEQIRRGDTVRVRVAVTNTGARKGDQVVQLYLRDKVSSVTRPVKELASFGRVSLAPGARGEVTLTVLPEAFSFIGLDNRPITEAGEFDLMTGPDSENLQTVTVTLVD